MIYERFRRWRDDGPFDCMLERLQLPLDTQGCIDPDLWCVDSTHIRASCSAAGGGKRGAARRAQGPSRRRLDDIGVKTLRYLYDFGDGWEHTIRIERVGDAEPGVAYPRLIDATGRCPPEDIGGPWGYGEFLEAIADPKHERHAELTEWIGEVFDPGDVDAEGHAQAIATLAKQWSRKPAVKRKRTT